MRSPGFSIRLDVSASLNPELSSFSFLLPWPPPKTDSLLTTNRRFSRPISRSLLIYFNYTPVIIINYRVSIHVRYRNPVASARSSQPASQTDQASLSTTNYAGQNNLGESLRVLGWAARNGGGIGWLIEDRASPPLPWEKFERGASNASQARNVLHNPGEGSA